MSRVERVRQSLDGTLDRWQTRVEAMEAHLDASQTQAMERVEGVKKSYLHTIDKVKTGIGESKSLAVSEKERLQTRLDEARVQFALGKAETEDEFNRQCRALKSGLSQLEREIDSELTAFDAHVDESLDRVAKDLVDAGNALDAEMDAMTTHFQTMKAQATAEIEEQTVKAKSELASFKEKINAKRGDASANIHAFNSEFDAGWNQIRSAFKNLK
jgi:hypothetical protein